MRIDWKPPKKEKIDQNPEIENILNRIAWNEEMVLQNTKELSQDLRTLLQSKYLAEACGETLENAKQMPIDEWMETCFKKGAEIKIIPTKIKNTFTITICEHWPENEEKTIDKSRIYKYPSS